MLTKSRRKELEERWERNKREHEQAGAHVSIVAFLPDDMTDMANLYRGPSGPQRARHRSRRTKLRGTDFVQKLAGLALEWHDQRFTQCVRGLFELGIVDKQSHEFTKKRGPHAISPIDSAIASAVTKVQELRDQDPDLSENEACAVVAADLLWNAASHNAAYEHLRIASRQARKATGKQARS
jgi:hypothetical protein